MKISVALQNWLRAALFPYKCVVCRQEGVVLCSGHQHFKRPVLPPLNHFKNLDGLYAASDYHQANARNLVRFLKFHHHRYLAEVMAQELLAAVPDRVWNQGVVVPLPLHWWRRWQRGFNQAELLAQALKKARPSLRLELEGLQRTRFTKQQARLGRSERVKNMGGAFSWRSASPPPGQVILLDDVCTTGSTLQAASQALKQAGTTEVIGVTFAYQSLAKNLSRIFRKR